MYSEIVISKYLTKDRQSTTEQTHRLLRVLNDALDKSQYCSAVFLGISQSFDKVWHTGLLYKLRRSLPLNYLLILNFYLTNRHFVVKVNTELTGLTPVNAVVPQGSVLALYYTSYIQPTFQPRLTPSQPPLPTTLQSSPLTVILPLLPRNSKPPS
jgi:hypothetical protein